MSEDTKVRFRNIRLAEDSLEWRRNYGNSVDSRQAGRQNNQTKNSSSDKYYFGNYDYSFTSLTPEEEERVLSGGGGETPEGVVAAAQKKYLDEHPDVERVTRIVNRDGRSYVVQQDFVKVFSYNCPHPGWRYKPVSPVRILGVYGVSSRDAENMARAQTVAWKVRERARQENNSYMGAGMEEADELLRKYYGSSWDALWRANPHEAYRIQKELGVYLSHLAWDSNAIFTNGVPLGQWLKNAEKYKEKRQQQELHAFHQYEAETENALRKNDYALWLRNPAEYAMKKEGYTPPRGFLYGFGSAFTSNLTFGLSEFFLPRSSLPDYLLATVGKRPAGFNPHNPMPRNVADRYLRYATDYFRRHPEAEAELYGELAGDIIGLTVAPKLWEKMGEVLAPRIAPFLSERLGGVAEGLVERGSRLVEEGRAAIEASVESERFIGSGAVTGRLKILGGKAIREGGLLLEFAREKLSPILEPREWRVKKLEAIRLESGEPVGGTRLTPITSEEVVREKPPASSIVRLEDIVGYQGRGFLYDTEEVSRLRYRLYSARRAIRDFLGLGDDYFDVFEARQLYGGGPARLNVEAWGVPGQTDIGFTGVVSDEVWYRGAPSSKYRSPLYMEGKIGGSMDTKVLAPEFDETRGAFRVRFSPGRPRYPKQALEKTIDAVLSEVWENPESPNISLRLDNLFNAWLKPSEYAEPTVYERFVGVKLPAKWGYPIDTGTETLRSVKTNTILDRIGLRPGFGVTTTKIGYDVKEWTIDLGLWPRAAAERLAGAAAEAEEALKGKRILGLYIDIDSVFTLPKEEPGAKLTVELPGAKTPGPGPAPPETPKVEAPGAGPIELGGEPKTPQIPGTEMRTASGAGEIPRPGPGGEVGGGDVGVAQASAGQIQLFDIRPPTGSAPKLRIVSSPILGFKPVYAGPSPAATGALMLITRVSREVGQPVKPTVKTPSVSIPFLGFKPKPTVKKPTITIPGLFSVQAPKLSVTPRRAIGPTPGRRGAVKPVEAPGQAQPAFTAPILGIQPVSPPPPPPIPIQLDNKKRGKPKKPGGIEAAFRLRPIRLFGDGSSPYDVIKITRPREFLKIF